MPLRPQLEILASATGSLSPRQARLVGGMLEELARLSRRRGALQAATAILNPEGGLSTWQLARRLEAELRRFDGQPRRRIEAGSREPTPWECVLLILASEGPRCARKLWDEVREL